MVSDNGVLGQCSQDTDITYNIPCNDADWKNWQMPIPEDWVAGSYNIEWKRGNGNNVPSGEISVTIPALSSSDFTSPVVNVPANIIMNTTSISFSRAIQASDGYIVTATDNVGVVNLNCSGEGSGSFGPVDEWGIGYVAMDPATGINHITITCTATDAAGNVGTASFTFTVNYTLFDITPPVVVPPGSISLSITNSTGTTVTYQNATATDNVGVSWIACDPASDTIFPVGTTTVTCTASDAVGNQGTTSFTVTVIFEPEPTPTVTASAYLNATSPTGRTLEIAGDNWSGGALIAIYKGVQPIGGFVANVISPLGLANDPTTGELRPFQLPIPEDWTSGTYDIFWRAYYDDQEGWQGADIQTYGGITHSLIKNDSESNTLSLTVPALSSSDTTPPVVTVPDDFVFLENSCSTQPTTPCSLHISSSFLANNPEFVGAASPSATDDIGVTSLKCSSSSFDVWLVDTSNSYNTYNTLFGWTWSTFTDEHIVTCTATDAAGNVGSASFTVTIVNPAEVADTTPPVVTTLPNVTLLATNSSGWTHIYTLPTATDNVSVNVVTCTPPPGSKFPVGATTQYPQTHLWGDATTVTCSATDFAGNVGTASFTVTVLMPKDWVTLNASAYLNSTSTTGRTLTITLGDTPPMLGPDGSCVSTECATEFSIYDTPETTNDIRFSSAVMSKDGSVVKGSVEYDASLSWEFRLNKEVFKFQMPIPADWEAGTYDITTHSMCCHASDSIHPSTTVTIPALSGTAEEEEIVIPDWVKFNAGWWDDGLIDDRNYVTGLQWLISNGVMTIPSTAQGTGSDDVVPSWVKNNAGWWADGSIDDRNYVTGLQWLITNGIMTIG